MIVPRKTWIGIALLVCLVVGCGDAPNTREVSANMNRVAEIRSGLVGAGGESSDADAGDAGPQPTGWATLKGTFKVEGAAPEMAMLPVNKDTEVCKPVPDEAVVVGPDGGLKNVVIYLTTKISDEEPWCHPSAKPGKTDPVEFDQKECVFLSHVLAMQVSQPMVILNSDSVGHNTNMTPKSNSGFNQIIPAGGRLEYQASAEESQPFAIACSIHPWMSASAIFRKNSYFAVTDENGNFEIPNLPAGVELEFRVWQERTKFMQSVTVNGESQRWSKGKYVVSALEPDQATEIQVVVNSSTLGG